MQAQKGNEEEIAKYSKRTVRVTREHNDECRRLLKLMGVPIVDVSVAFMSVHGSAIVWLHMRLIAFIAVQLAACELPWV